MILLIINRVRKDGNQLLPTITPILLIQVNTQPIFNTLAPA